jgi:transposase
VQVNTAVEISDYEAIIAEKDVQIAQLKFELAQLKRMIFGTKRERFIPQSPPEQLSLAFDSEEEAAVPTLKETVTYTRNKPQKKQPKRQPLPPDLPRIDVIIEPEEDVRGWKKIGELITEELDYVPGRFQVIRYIRPKYVPPVSPAMVESSDSETAIEITSEKAVVIAPLPTRPIEKGIPSAGLLAHILMSKFVDHLPYYRQIQQFKRIGMTVKASTINGWVAKSCALLEVLYNKLCELHFMQHYLQADETPIKVITPEKSARRKKGKGKTHRGYFWVYHDPLGKNVVFKYDAGRGRKYPAHHLQNFAGHLQTDGLSVYDAFDTRQDITLLGCMAHVRRKFEEALGNDATRAGYVLKQIQQLYAIERSAREDELSHDQRRVLRQEHALPIMKQLKIWLQENMPKVLPKSAIGKAIAYALNRWKYLERYVENGKLEIDNNLVENAIRPVALGRKNYLFAGSEEGAAWAAILYSLFGSAIRHGHNPFDYLSDVLSRLPDLQVNQLEQLLPANWNPAKNWEG